MPNFEEKSKNEDKKEEERNYIGAIKYLLKFILKYKWRYFGGFCLTITSAALNSATPYLIKKGIDALEHGATKAFITYIALAVASFGLIRSITLFFGRNIIVGTGRLVEKEIREDVYRKIINIKTEFFDREGTGKISSRIINDVDNIRMMLGFGGMIVFHILFIFVFSLVAELLFSPKLTLISSIPLLGITLSVIAFERKLYERSERVQEALSEITDFSQERLSLIKLIKNFILEKKTEKEFEKLSQKYKNNNLSLAKTYGLFEAVISLLSLLSLLIVIVLGSRMLMNGEISKGVFAGFIAYQLSLIWPAMAIGYLIIIGERGLACTSRIIWLTNQKKELWFEITGSKKTHDGKVEILRPDIKIINLNYGILKNINIDIPAGTKLGVVGKTGSGKSTLLNLLMRIYEPPENTIFLDGKDINLIDELTFRKTVAGVLQENFFFSTTIKENILIGDFEILDISPEEALEIAEFSVEDFPNGMDEVLGEKGTKLSGGQKERLALARAIARNPKILILDDPFANIDVQTEMKIMRKILRLAEERKMTVIMATHRGKILEMFDRIILLERGEIKDEGEPKEMITRSEFLKRVCEAVY